jgi:hypothetical protein
MRVALEPTQINPVDISLQEIRLDFTLKHWCLWQSADTVNDASWPDGEILPYHGGLPDVGFLPLMQRRRLSLLAMAATAVAWHCRQKCGDMPSVFHSNHGESHYYFEMLQSMTEGEVVSPSRFSLCVHNAIAGLSSLHSNCPLPYVSLAGGTDGMFAGFLEVGGMLLETTQVLLVCYEQALPDAYRPYLANSDTTWAFALVLTKAGGSGRQLRLTRSVVGLGDHIEPHPKQLIQTIMDGQGSSVCQLERSTWQWSLEDA